ncbi:MAG: hypothetical protein WBG38_07665 [Nodosilinea sp.]
MIAMRGDAEVISGSEILLYLAIAATVGWAMTTVGGWAIAPIQPSKLA